MCVKTTEKGIRKFSKDEKLAILQEASKTSLKATLEKYALYPATFYYWKKKYEQLGSAGLDHSVLKERLQCMEVLEKENQKLKDLLAREKLESALKNDLLKKKYPHLRKLL